MTVFLEWIRHGGIFGILVLYLAALLLLLGIALLCITRKRRIFAIYLILALVPLGVGALGTLLGRARAEQAAAVLPDSDPAALRAMIAQGRREARVTTYLGLTATTPLLLMGLFGFAAAKKTSAPVDRPSA